jgi:hypothetical protein
VTPPREPAAIALVFDFDDTLAPDSTSKVLEAIGLDPPDFWARHRTLLEHGWDQVPAYMHMMLDESRARGGAITRDLIEDVGRRLRFYPGVTTMFTRYKQLIESDDRFQAHFYVISSGLGDLIRATRIHPSLTDAWGSDFAYDDAGAICAIKNAISFSDKTRYLFQISKGQIGPAARTNPVCRHPSPQPWGRRASARPIQMGMCTIVERFSTGNQSCSVCPGEIGPAEVRRSRALAASWWA